MRLEDEGEATLVVLRCERCGDTFPTAADEPSVCRGCGSDRVAPAREPLL
jgi:rRNA maturation endonuclease Nob1